MAGPFRDRERIGRLDLDIRPTLIVGLEDAAGVQMVGGLDCRMSVGFAKFDGLRLAGPTTG